MHKVSPKCEHYWIDAIRRRAGREPFQDHANGEPAKPLKWSCQAVIIGERPRIFI
jgi:hypothetical protein